MGAAEPGPQVEARLRAALLRPGRPSSDFDLNPGLPRPAAGPARPAAVLVAVDVSGSGAGAEPRVILTTRASHLRHHPGQVAFPGGRLEPGEGAAEGALREAREEVGLDPASAQVLGSFGSHETVTGFAVTAVVALVRRPLVLVPLEAEVAEVFSVPFAHVADPASFRVEGRRWGGHVRHYYVVPWGPHYVWGATARILYALAHRLAEA